MSKATDKLTLGGIVERELAVSENNSTGGETNRAEAMQYYLAQLPGKDPVAGRSNAVSTDVADMVTAVMAIMVPMLSTDCVAEFEPDSEEDEGQAKAESYVVGGLIIEDNLGFIEIQEAVKDGLLMRNGVMKVTVDDAPLTQTFSLTHLEESQYQIAVNTVIQAGQQAELRGDSMIVTAPNRAFSIAAVPVENMSWTAGFAGKMRDIPFIAEAMEKTRSELVEMGIDKGTVAKLRKSGQTTGETVKEARNRGTPARDAVTADQDVINCHEAYVLTDLDGDGISERYQVIVANKKECLLYERVDLVPYAIGSPFINPHRIAGESLFDHLKPTQEVKTTLLRQLLNNLGAMNNGRYIYDPNRANEDDILNPTPGGGIRARDPSAVVPVIVPDTVSGILMALTYEDKQRTERSGAALDMMGADAQIVGETAHGVERQYGSREAMVNLMAANLSETLLRSLFLLTHEYLRRYADKPFGARIAGEWVQTDPRQWKPRKRLNVKTGKTPGIRGAQQTVLQMNAQFQAQAIGAGMNGVLAGPDQVYRGMIEWLNMAGISNPERFWIDPASPQAQQAMQGIQQAAQQQQQQVAQMQSMMAQLEGQKLEIERLKVQVDAKKNTDTIALGYAELQTKVDLEEAKMSGQGVIDLEKERMKNETAINLKRIAGAESGAASARGDA